MDYGALLVDYAGTFTDVGMAEVVAGFREGGLKVALLSNADRAPAGLADLFDAVVVSGEVGIGKPHPEIYRIAAARLGVAPQRCVFVDDVAGHVRGAAAVGMTGVHHRSLESTVEELAALLG